MTRAKRVRRNDANNCRLELVSSINKKKKFEFERSPAPIIAIGLPPEKWSSLMYGL